MSLKLSRNKVNYLSNLIVDFIENNEEIDYIEDIGNIRMKVYHLITMVLREFEDIERRTIDKISTQKKSVPEGSREWEILFRKYSNEELNRLGKIWD